MKNKIKEMLPDMLKLLEGVESPEIECTSVSEERDDYGEKLSFCLRRKETRAFISLIYYVPKL